MSKRKRKFPWGILVVVLIVLGVGGYFGFNYLQSRNTSSSSTNLQTVAVTKGSLSATIGASGNVRAIQTATLTWSAAGRVGTINVKQGDTVKFNDVLGTIDPTSITASALITAPQDLLNAQKALADLQTSRVPQAQAQAALVKAQKAYDDAKTNRDLLNYSRANNGGLDAAYAQLYLAQDALTKAQDKFTKVAGLAENDPARASAQASLVSAQQNVNSKQSIVNWYLSGPGTIDIAQADSDLAMAKAQLDDAQRQWDLLKNGPTAADLTAAQNKINQIQITLNTMKILAPFPGTITDIKSIVGDVVSNNTQAMRIDNMSTMLIDLTVSEVDIDRVKAGQKVTVTFDAIPSKTYNGVVDSIDDAGTISSGAVNFIVTVKMTDADKNVKPGMTASASIVLEQVQDVLLVPNKAVRTQNTRRYILVLKDGQIQTINVRLGLSSDTQTQVIADQLAEGDQVVTNALSDLQKNSSLNLRIPGVGAVTGGAGGGGLPGGGGGGTFPGGGGGFPGGGTGGTGGAGGGR